MTVHQNRQSLWQKYDSKIRKLLDVDNVFTRKLKEIEEKTGYSRVTLITGGGLFLLIYLLIGYGARFLATLVGFVFPAYASIKAIESAEKEDDTRWLTYWVVFASLNLLEVVCLNVFFHLFSGYAVLKCAFLIWCMTPGHYNGAFIIYHRVIFPLFKRHQTYIDSAIHKVGETAGELTTEITNSNHFQSTLSAAQTVYVRAVASQKENQS